MPFWRYRLHTVKSTYSRCTIQGSLWYLQNCITTATVYLRNISITPQSICPLQPPREVPTPAFLILAKFIGVAPTLWLVSLVSSLLLSPRGMGDLGCQKAAREFCRTVLHFDGGGNTPLCTQKSTFLPMNRWNGLKTSKQMEKKQSITIANGNQYCWLFIKATHSKQKWWLKVHHVYLHTIGSNHAMCISGEVYVNI